MAEDIETLKQKVIIIGLLRDSIKELSPKYVYRSQQHRDDLYNAIIEASEQLEEQLQEQLDSQAGEEEEDEASEDQI